MNVRLILPLLSLLLTTTSYGAGFVNVQSSATIPTYPTTATLPGGTFDGAVGIALNNHNFYIYDAPGAAWNVIGAPTATPPVVVTGTAVSIPRATTSVNGYLASTDWTTFNNKQPTIGYTAANQAGDTFTGTVNLPSNGLVVGTNQLVVSSSKVGIGTAVPATPLTVYAVGAASGGLRVVSDLTGNPFEIQNAGGTHWMYMDTSSNTWFHGGVYADEGALHTGAGVVAYGFGSDYTTGLFQSTHGVLNFSSNGTEAMRLDASQNLAIGTTTAGAKLEVNGGVRLNTATAKGTCDSTRRGTLWIAQGASGATDTLYACLKAVADTYSWVSVITGG